MTQDLYSQLVQILEPYLGPSTDRFVSRHIEAHFNKSVEQVSRSDIPELATWIKLSMSILSDDTQLIRRCEQKVLGLARP